MLTETQEQDYLGSCPEPKELAALLPKILASTPFCTSPRMAQFLSYIFERTIEDDLDSLKETCIGVAVFDRSPTYAPRDDGIVRVEARRLRNKLQQYYDNEGKDDRWVLTLPKGSYKLAFHRRISLSDTQDLSGAHTLVQHLPPLSVNFDERNQEPDFAALVEEVSTDLGPQPSLRREATKALDKPRLSALRRWPVFLAVVCLCIALAAWTFSRYYSDVPTDAKIVRLTTQIGQELQPALSPDGKYLVYVWDGGGDQYNLYLQAVAGGVARRLTQGNLHHLHPAWSPDGRDIAYVRISPQLLELVLIPAAGGAERVVSSFAPTAPPWHADASQISGQWSVSWSASGHELVTNVVPMNEGIPATALYSIALDGFDPPKQVTHPRPGELDSGPAVSPNGRSLAFFRTTSKQTGDIWLIDFDSGSERRLTSSRSDVPGMTWTPDGRSIIYSSAKDGPYALWSLDVASGTERLVRSEGADLKGPQLSRDGARLIFSDSTTTSNVWQQALDREGLPEGKPFRLAPSSRNSQSARFSPDGRQIAFVSNRSGHWELWRADKGGENVLQLTHFEGPLVDAPHWSPQGDQIVFEARPGARSAIFSIPATGGTPKQLSQTDADEKMPVWSSDGRWIYFNSTATGRPLIWRMNPDGAQRGPVSDQTGWDLVERPPDLIFVSQDQYLYSVPETGGRAERLSHLGTVGLSRYFAYANDTLFFIRNEDDPILYRYTFANSKLETVMRLPEKIVTSTPSLSLSSDGRKLLFARQESANSAVYMIPFKR